MRFSVTAKKQQHHIQYQEELTLDIYLKDANKVSDTALYSLVGVVVHEGNSIKGGHYVAYVKRSGQWYRTDDLRVTKVSTFEATHQQAYLLFHQKAQKLPCPSGQSKRSRLSLKKCSRVLDMSGKQNIHVHEEKQKNGTNVLKRGSAFAQSKDLSKCYKKESTAIPTSSHSNTKGKAFNAKQVGNTKEKSYNVEEDNKAKGNDRNTKDPTAKKKPTAIKGNSEDVITHEQTKHVKRPVSTRTLPPNYYMNDNQCSLPTKPRVVRSSNSACVSYPAVSETNKQKAEIVAQKGVKPRKHPRLAGWAPDDMLCLLPHQSGTGSWLSNFVVNHFLLLLEEKATKIGNKVKTLNCNVLDNMTKPCKKMFVKNKYSTLYPNVSDSDVILSLFNQGQHWTLLSVFPREKRMVFLDSLFKGSAAETAFSRCCNFLTCATEEGIDWSEWQFLIIPEEHIPQQLNLYDCGMFSIKWAEHIAFGIPLDFQPDNIVDFRYSTILSLFTQNVEVDYQYCKISEGENTMENTQFTTDRTEENLSLSETKIHRTQNNDTEKAVLYPHISNTSPLFEHNYAKNIDTGNSQSSISKMKSSTLPAEVAAVLPPAYKYNILKMEHIETECFVGSPKDAFILSFTIADIINKDDVLKWKKAFSEFSNLKYNVRQGSKRKGKTVSFSQWYICQCERKKLTKKQEDAKSKVQERRNKAIGNKNNDTKEFHLLSNLRNKKTNCPSKMSIKLFTKRSANEMCEVKLFWNHNHSTECYHLKTFHEILPATKQTFEEYFENGLSPSEAIQHHEAIFLADPANILKVADRRYCPSSTDVRNLFNNWRGRVKGPSNGQEMFEKVKQLIHDYNKKNNIHGGSCCLQEYTHGNDEKPLILTIVTPLMSRVHSLPQASEMAFLDASSSLDRYNNRVFFLCTHHPSGSLPLAVWVSSDGSLDTNNKSIAMLKSVLPKHAFGGKGPNGGPSLFMTDDDAAEKGALQEQWPDSTQLLCIFHFLQAMWRWLWDGKHEIKKDDRKHLMSYMQNMVFAESKDQLEDIYVKLTMDTVALAYPNFLKHVKDCYARQKEWSLCHRKDLKTRGNNTDNYTESLIFVFKCTILHRIRAYNLLELFKFITGDLEKHFQRKLLALAFGKPQNLNILARCFAKTACTVNLDTVIQDDKNPFQYHVPSRKQPNTIYTVDCSTGICTCPAGNNGTACPHQAAVVLKYGISNPNFIPQNHHEKYNLAVTAIGEHPDLRSENFVNIHQKELEKKPGYSLPLPVPSCDDLFTDKLQKTSSQIQAISDSIAFTNCDTTCFPEEKDFDQEEIVKLHKEVTSDIEMRLRNGDANFRECYMKYLQQYRKIILKARGPSSSNCLASAYADFGKDQNGKLLPVLHRSNKRIHVQPTAIARRKSGVKSTSSQPSGPKPERQLKRTINDINFIPDNNISRKKRKRNLSLNVQRNQPNAGHTR